MPSRALLEWRTTQRAELDRVEGLLRRVRGRTAEERAVRLLLVGTSMLLLAGHFQRYCRDLYAEAVDFLVMQVQPEPAAVVLRLRLVEGLQLARGNAHTGSLTADFKRLGVNLSTDLLQRDPRNARRLQRLDQLNVWRNAVAHQDPRIASRRATLLEGTGRNVRTVRLAPQLLRACARS